MAIRIDEKDVFFSNMTLEDLPSVLEIERALFIDPWPEKAFIEDIENPFSKAVVIKNHEDIIYGYIIYWRAADEIHILNIAVHPQKQRKGYGKMLLEYAIKDGILSNFNYIVLEVRMGNIPAQELYKKYGFVIIGIRKKYYKNGEDALVLFLDLKDPILRNKIE